MFMTRNFLICLSTLIFTVFCAGYNPESNNHAYSSSEESIVVERPLAYRLCNNFCAVFTTDILKNVFYVIKMSNKKNTRKIQSLIDEIKISQKIEEIQPKISELENGPRDQKYFRMIFYLTTLYIQKDFSEKLVKYHTLYFKKASDCLANLKRTRRFMGKLLVMLKTKQIGIEVPKILIDQLSHGDQRFYHRLDFLEDNISSLEEHFRNIIDECFEYSKLADSVYVLEKFEGLGELSYKQELLKLKKDKLEEFLKISMEDYEERFGVFARMNETFEKFFNLSGEYYSKNLHLFARPQ